LDGWSPAQCKTGERIWTTVANKIGPQNSDTDKENNTELSHALGRFWDIKSLGIKDEVATTIKVFDNKSIQES